MIIHDIHSTEERQWTLLQEECFCQIASGQGRWDWKTLNRLVRRDYMWLDVGWLGQVRLVGSGLERLV